MGRTNKRRCHQCGKYHRIGEKCKVYEASPKGKPKKKKLIKAYRDDNIRDEWY